MKKVTYIFKTAMVMALLFFIPQPVEAQFLKKLKEKAEKKIEREAEKRAERRVNKKIDKEFDNAEDVLDGKGNEKKEGNEENSNKNTKEANNSNNANVNGEAQQANKPTVVWSKFDFIPGDEIIYEDGPSADEENGEFPSRWDTAVGNAEIVNIDGEPAITYPSRGSKIVPYLKNSKEDYLPEVFTIEFDCYFKRDEPTTSYTILLYDLKNQDIHRDIGRHLRISIYDDNVSEWANGSNNYDYNGANNLNSNEDGIWRHISIAFTKGKLKVYMDEIRLVNIPHYEYNPSGLTLEGNGNSDAYSRFVKNIRIAKGGVKYYDRVLSEGKIIVNGIKFDVNKATLKPESMGPINEIYQLMIDNPTVNFSVEGHTDSDGVDASNMTLSIARGKTVMDKLISMGISSERLKSNGFGESKPIGENSTSEGKANNRRVEFVKF